MAGMSIDMFIGPDQDPRTEPPGQGSELATLTGFLNYYRQTLELKCSGLDAAALATRSVEPSKMSLLGLVRHMSDVERNWFRRFMAGQDAQDRFSSSEDIDGDWDGARADAFFADLFGYQQQQIGDHRRVAEEDGRVEITLAVDGSSLSIRDNGIGLRVENAVSVLASVGSSNNSSFGRRTSA